MAYLDNNGVLYFWSKIKNYVSTAVAGFYTKPSGGIPASDLAAGVIPTVPQMATQDNMSDWTSGKTVDAAVLATGFNSALGALQRVAMAVDDIDTSLSTKANSADVYTKTEIDGKLTNAYVYKGSVATVSDLPSSGVENGWVYNVEASGMNYAWNGSAWDALGETFTITAITNAEIDTICT